MTAAQQATQEILKVTGKDSAPEAVKAKALTVVENYYNAKGGMAKAYAVGLLIDVLEVKYGEYAGRIATQLM